MITAAGTKAIPGEWIDFRGSNIGYVKQGFRDQVLETLKKEGEASRIRLEERLKSGNWENRLTAEQKQYLKDNFDLKNMSWEDYQTLVGKLCEYGALDEEDKKYLHCQFSGLEMTYVDLSGPTCTANFDTASVRNSSAFASWKGDILGWTKYLSGFQGWDAESQSWKKTPEAALFGRFQDLLKEISK